MERFSTLFLLVFSGFIAAFFMNARRSKEDENINLESTNNFSLEKEKNLSAVCIEESSNEGSFKINNSEIIGFNSEEKEVNKSYSIIERNLSDKILKITGFKIPKSGNQESECEDGFLISSENNSLVRVAISDGATESLFSNIWANLLIDAYVKNGLQAIESSGINSVYQSFIYQTGELINEMPETTHWRIYEKISRGTNATFAAVELSNSSLLNLTTVGDSCIFWRNEVEKSFGMQPKLEPEDFDSFSESICHIPETWKNLNSKFIRQEIKLGDKFQLILCTDAFACWLLKALRKDLLIWDEIFKISTSEEFLELIKDLRRSQEIKNDDVTLVTVNAVPINV